MESRTSRHTVTTLSPGHALMVSTVAFDSTGERFVSASWDQSVRLWDSHTRRQIRCFGDPIDLLDLLEDDGNGNIFRFHCAEFSMTGDKIIAGAQDGALYSWDLSDGREDRLERAHDSPILALAMHPHGQQFASAGRDGLVVMWSLPEIRRLYRFNLLQAVHYIRFSPDGRLLAATCDNGSVRIIRLDMKIDWAHLETDDCAYHCIAFSLDGHYLATAGMDDTLALWDTRTWTITQRFQLHSATDDVWALCVAFDHSGTRLAAGGSDGIVRIWDLASSTLCREILVLDSSLNTLAFHPTRDELVIGGSCGRMTWHTFAGNGN